MPLLSVDDFLSKLDALVARADALSRVRPEEGEFERWHRDTRVLLSRVFGATSQHITDFTSISYTPNYVRRGAHESLFAHSYLKGLAQARQILRSILDEVSDYGFPMDAPGAFRATVTEEAESGEVLSGPPCVFIIHGHDDASKTELARFLEKLDLVPIVLHEQPNRGQTIIEKFEAFAGVAYAVALLTADDVGSVKSDQTKASSRARQNVVFELGYMMAKLGRQRVCALVDAGVELPSDYNGVLYVPLDAAGAWKVRLMREMRAAGIPVDANKAF